MVVNGKLYYSSCVIHGQKSSGYPLVMMLGASQCQFRRGHKNSVPLLLPGFYPRFLSPPARIPVGTENTNEMYLFFTF